MKFWSSSDSSADVGLGCIFGIVGTASLLWMNYRDIDIRDMGEGELTYPSWVDKSVILTKWDYFQCIEIEKNKVLCVFIWFKLKSQNEKHRYKILANLWIFCVDNGSSSHDITWSLVQLQISYYISLACMTNGIILPNY